MSEPQPELLIVSGLSGAGKSIVLDMLEDLDYYCMDNLPLSMLGSLHPRALAKTDVRCNRMAIGIDARTGGNIDQVPVLIDTLRDANPGFNTRVLFLHADTDVLLKRFSETRRKHPLTNENTSLTDALSAERTLLEPIASIADFTIETSHSNLHELRERVRRTLASSNQSQMMLQLQSFGFKHGVPDGVDLVFDVRCLPNPHWEPSLRSLTGRDPAIQKWLGNQAPVINMSTDIGDFLSRWLPAYQKQNRNYLTVAIGCTGGQHRSVYLVEKLAEHLAKPDRKILIRHTEIR
ncbi:MAG: RNase adapter RapZ [Oceanococcus sp.]